MQAGWLSGSDPLAWWLRLLGGGSGSQLPCSVVNPQTTTDGEDDDDDDDEADGDGDYDEEEW